jgi:homoaconitate hydratase
LNLGLFNIVVRDEKFYDLASEGRLLTIDKRDRTLSFEGSEMIFRYQHSAVEDTLLRAGGILNLYNIHGRSVFREMIKAAPELKGLVSAGHALEEGDQGKKRLDW